MTSERSIADYFEATVNCGASTKRAANLIQSQGLRLANERSVAIADLGISPQHLAELCNLTDTEKISATAAAAIFTAMLESDDSPERIAQQKNLMQLSDVSALESIVAQVLADNAKAVDDYRSGGKKAKKARGFLLGQVIQKTKGQANPKIAGDLIDRKVLDQS